MVLNLCVLKFILRGIVYQTTIMGTLQQNGCVERKHHHILNVARALCFQANLLVKLWGECVMTTAYLMNRTPSVLLNGKPPFEMLHGKVALHSQKKVSGCLAIHT